MTETHFPVSGSDEAIPLMLVRMVLDGRCSLEDLDQPSPNTKRNLFEARRVMVQWNIPPIAHRNLAREWISANPTEWKQLQKTRSAGNG